MYLPHQCRDDIIRYDGMHIKALVKDMLEIWNLYILYFFENSFTNIGTQTFLRDNVKFRLAESTLKYAARIHEIKICLLTDIEVYQDVNITLTSILSPNC